MQGRDIREVLHMQSYRCYFFFFGLVRKDTLWHNIFTIIGDGFCPVTLFYHLDIQGSTGFYIIFGGGLGTRLTLIIRLLW